MRIFKCAACGHRMRLRGPQCGTCYESKPLWQSPRIHKAAGFMILLGLCGAITLKVLPLRF